MALTRAQLDEAVCDNPACDEQHGPLYMHSRCHPGAPTWSYYDVGVLFIECAECRQIVAAIAVAAE